LERTDPLLNTILPGTGVSVVVNFGERWACGLSPATSAFLPKVSVIGPVTRPLVLQVGVHVQAIGAAFLASETEDVLRVRTSELVDQIVPLADLWSQQESDALVDSISDRHARYRVSGLCRALVGRTQRPRALRLEDSACRLITRRHGAVSIEELARSHGISRRQFSSRFSTATGMPPKLYARITRFQTLVHTLLSTDVSQWGAVASTVGFYDQAHMINEFRQFAGSPPTIFFQPHGDTVDIGAIQRRGRPSEWVSITR
jgi:methylphosphotriester-DNA--protein-cysteine methyltransferase